MSSSRAARRVSWRSLGPWVLLLGVAGGAPVAAQVPPGFPGQGEDYLNLGILGAGVEVSDATIEVRKVYAGGSAQTGGLQAGDRIVGVGGRPLAAESPANPAGPVGQVIAEIERCEASKKRVPVVLRIQRAGAEQELELRVEKLGKHAKSCPKKCKKCQKVVAAGLEFLAKTQDGSGMFASDMGANQPANVAVSSLAGLAFVAANAGLGSNGPVERAANYVLRTANVEKANPFGGMGGGMGNMNQSNWELGYGLMFLAEATRVLRRGELQEKCAELAAKIYANQEATGGWAHGPGGPNALGYLELQIISNYLLLGLGAAERLGVELDDAKVTKALDYIESTSSGDGGVGYSHRPGQKGHGDPGRTAGALLAYASLGQSRRPFFTKMTGFYQRNMKTLVAGHVSPCMHLLAGAMAAKRLGKQVWKQYMETFRLHIMGARKPDGSFAATPTQESQALRNNTDAGVGPRWTTATYVLILSLDQEKLPFLMGGKDKGGKPIRVRPKTGGGR